MTEAEDAAIDLVEIAARAARRGRGEGPGAARRRAAGRRASSASSGSTRRSRPATGFPSRSAGPVAGSCSARTASASVQTTWDAVSRGRPRDAAADAVRLPPGRDGRRLGADADGRRATTDLAAVRAARSSRSTDRPTSAGRARGSSTASSCWPRSSTRTRSSTSRRSGRGRRSGRSGDASRCRFARRSTACGAGPPHTCRGPDDLEGWAQLCPDCVGKAGDNGFLRFRLRQALTERGPRPGRSRRRCSRPSRAAAAAADADPTSTPTCSPTTRPGARVRRLVPAPRPLRARARSTTRPGTPSSTRPGAGSTRCRSAARSSSSPPGPAGGRRCSPRRASCRSTTRRAAPLDRARERLVAHSLRAHLHVRDAWAEPDRAGRRRLHRASG